MTELPKRELLERKLHKVVESARGWLGAKPVEGNTEYRGHQFGVMNALRERPLVPSSKGLKKFKKFFPDLPYGQLIIYAGDISQSRTDVKVITVNRFSELLESIDP